jgi:hypothetical protein
MSFALVRRFPVVRGFEVARRFAVFRCFEVVRRFTGFRFFRDERGVAARTDCAGGLSFRSVVFHFAAQLSDHCSCWSGQALASYPNTSADPQTLVKHYCFWQSSGIFIKFGTLSLCARSSYELPPGEGECAHEQTGPLFVVCH